MAHYRYETKGFILGRRSYGESALLLSVLSRDFGMVPVLAQGVREEHSKHRMVLSTGRPLAVSLVRGHEWWRLVGVRAEEATIITPIKQQLLERLSIIVRHYVHGEWPEPELFAVFADAWNLPESILTNKEEILRQECLLVSRLLSVLGYLNLPNNWQTDLSTKVLLTKINACLSRGIN
ncbi:MAG: recombination protein O N-terminal domain-containing protein [Candidatus Vogelbacteria bacterium]|nr:recombination protein O N-terminal domain-containing protein [Candidatus Vogelbacteria bacterium]